MLAMTSSRKSLRRTEFIVLFVWNEPLSNPDFSGDAVPADAGPGGPMMARSGRSCHAAASGRSK